MIKIIDSKVHKGESGFNALFSRQQRPKRKTSNNIKGTQRTEKDNKASSDPPVKYKCHYYKKRGHKAAEATATAKQKRIGRMPTQRTSYFSLMKSQAI